MVRLEHKIPALARLQLGPVSAALLRSDARRDGEVFRSANKGQQAGLDVGGKVPVDDEGRRGLVRRGLVRCGIPRR